MGASIDAGRTAEVSFAVRGRDELAVVEIIQDGRVVHRFYADETSLEKSAFEKPIQLRLEWGWGPWGALALDRICDWEMEVTVEGGRLLRFFPCLQSMPFDEARRHRFRRNKESLAIRSYTARQNAYRENPNQSVVLEIEGDAKTAVVVSLKEPSGQKSKSALGELARGSVNRFTGPFPKEGWQWHRLVPLAASSVEGRCTLQVPAGRSHAYLRARQKNGHIAWASPVFMNYR